MNNIKIINVEVSLSLSYILQVLDVEVLYDATVEISSSYNYHIRNIMQIGERLHAWIYVLGCCIIDGLIGHIPGWPETVR